MLGNASPHGCRLRLRHRARHSLCRRHRPSPRARPQPAVCIITSQTLPILAIASTIVVFVYALGIDGPIPEALISTYLSFPPFTVGHDQVMRSPEVMHLDLMRTYNARPPQTFLKLRVPASIPFLFTSMKVAIAARLRRQNRPRDSDRSRRGHRRQTGCGLLL